MAIALSITLPALPGCDNRTPCEKLHDRIAECLGLDPRDTNRDGEGGTIGVCEARTACIWECFRMADCDQINDVTSSPASQPLRDCEVVCAKAFP
jgi:hypothetical protein